MKPTSDKIRRAHARELLSSFGIHTEIDSAPLDQFALVEYKDYTPARITFHASVAQAQAHSERVLLDGWRPTRIVDLNTRKVVADDKRDDFSWRSVVLIGHEDDRHRAAEHTLAQLRSTCGYDPVEMVGEGVALYLPLITYKHRLEELCLELLANSVPGLGASTDAATSPGDTDTE